jgi:hydroxymethylpyrimidine pyrophosphatase-like HAD family hydrolase
VYFLALATDYDGTLANRGQIGAEAVEALERFKDTGRRLILVTGRELPHMKEAFPRLESFDRVVAENGAVIYDPANGGKFLSVLGRRPPSWSGFGSLTSHPYRWADPLWPRGSRMKRR